jgi:hypothetical protein
MNYCSEIAANMKQGHALQARIRDGEKQLQIEVDRLQRLHDELRHHAADDFAKLNGWKHSQTDFAPGMLVRGSTQRKRSEYGSEGCWLHELFDHPVYFRKTRSPYRPVAIIGQPYNTDIASAREIATQIGLTLHVPPNLTASWWFPGWARFFCCTRPGQVVQFLPDQCNPCPEM